MFFKTGNNKQGNKLFGIFIDIALILCINLGRNGLFKVKFSIYELGI